MNDQSELLEAVAELLRESEERAAAREAALEARLAEATRQAEEALKQVARLEDAELAAVEAADKRATLLEDTVYRLGGKLEVNQRFSAETREAVASLTEEAATTEELTQRLQAAEDRVVEEAKQSAAFELKQLAEAVDGEVERLDEEIAKTAHTLDDMRAVTTETLGKSLPALQASFEDHTRGLGALQNIVQEGLAGVDEHLEHAGEAHSALAARVVELEGSNALSTAVGELKQTLNTGVADLVVRAQDQDSRITAHREDTRAEIQEGAENLSNRVEDALIGFEEEFAALRTETMLSHEQVLETALSAVTGWQESVEGWARGGAAYKELAVVRHGGALWQARTRTTEEPGKAGPEDSQWVLLADGVKDVQPQCNASGEVSFTTVMASGRTLQADKVFRLPVPTPRGVHDGAKEYIRYDAVVKDGHTFLALVDAPAGIGETDGEWLCIGHRGKTGRAARAAPTLDEVVADIRPAVVRDLAPELVNLVAVAVEDRE